MVGQQHADTANTLQLRDVAMANIFWLSIFAVHIGATRQIRLNHPCAAAMRPIVTDRVLHLMCNVISFVRCLPLATHLSVCLAH